MELPDLKVDDKVMVRNSDEDLWKRRHFSHFDHNGRVVCFDAGCTSWSADDYVAPWNHWRLPNEDEL